MSLVVTALIIGALIVCVFIIKKIAKIAIKGVFVIVLVIGLLFLLSKMFPNSGLADATAYIIKIIK